MSADNWQVCPRCLKRAAEAAHKEQLDLQASYGKVSEAEYRKRSERANKPVDLQETFREDYEIAVCEDGEFFVSYLGHCTECGLEHRYQHKSKVNLE